MHRRNTLDTLDELIQARSILRHPFYVAWERGELTKTQLATYARAYYPHVRAFPRYLEATIARADDVSSRIELSRNLADELSHPKAHHDLWLDFSESLGLDRRDVEAGEAESFARATVEAFEGLTQRDSVSGLSALYAYESQQPEVSCRKMAGLREWYGLHSEKGLAYFNVHAKTDIEHREGERNAIGRCLDNGASPELVLGAANDALDAYAGLLDGVCMLAGVSAASASVGASVSSV